MRPAVIKKLSAEALFAVDSRLGAVVSSAVTAHHRRRLARIGQHAALAGGVGGWADGEPPPRSGCSLQVLIDGEEAGPRMAADLAAATSHVYLAGWHFSPAFGLVRGPAPIILRNLLAELAERVDVYVLVWAGAPFPIFRPSRAAVREAMEELCRGTKIRWATDSKERPLHCHHEKTIVVDDRVAFVGGIDLTMESGDRFDGQAHVSRAAIGWHDVSARMEGPAVGDVAEHFRMRWREVTGEWLPAGSQTHEAGCRMVQVVRTVPERVYSSVPRGDFRILESYLRALRGAQSLIYIENQYLWSAEVADVLVDKLRRPPSDDFRLLLILPAKANTGTDDTRGMLAELMEADAGADRLLACTIYARHGPLSDPVYIHAKVAAVDDSWLTIGSANLNEHSLFNDTEMNVICCDADLVRNTRLRLWAEHLEVAIDEIDGAPTDVIERYWKPISREQRARREAREPLTHRLVELSNVSSRSERLLGPLQGLLVDG